MRPFLMGLAVAVTLGGCVGDRQEAAGARAAGAPAADAEDVASGSAEVAAARPEAAPVALPDWFPTDVYLPADYEVAEIGEGRGVHAVELRTPGEVFDVAEQARAGMLAAGWTENHYSPMDTRGGASMHYLKDDRSATLAMAWGNTGLVRVMYNFATLEIPGR